MNIQYLSLAAARNIDQLKFDAMLKQCFHEACQKIPQSELINALCENQRHSMPLKLAA
jgi:hypothetical protein